MITWESTEMAMKVRYNLILIGVMGIHFYQNNTIPKEKIGIPSEARLLLGAEIAGTKLDFAIASVGKQGSTFGPNLKRIGLTVKGKQTIVTSLNDFQGKVKITNDTLALRFVRLRTSFATWNMWPGNQLEVEIVRSNSVGKMPNYGTLSYRPSKRMYSGFLGVVSERAFKAGGFTEPTVEKTETGYHITRWLFVGEYHSKTKDEFSIMQVREAVGSDGAYQRVVLQKMAPPKLPDTTWKFPGSS